MQKALAILTLCVVALTWLPITTRSLTRINSNGKHFQMHSVSGFVVNVTKDRRSITLHWRRVLTTFGAKHITESNQQSFMVAEGVVFENG
jgi:hypothetical protein